MSVKVQDIKERISRALNSRLLPEGFVFKKTSNSFSRSVGNYTHVFVIDVLSWSDHFSIDVRIYISEKAIENLLEKIIGKQRYSFTLGGDIGKLQFSHNGKEPIHRSLSIIILFEEDISAAADSLYLYYSSIAKPFFDHYNNVEKFDDIFNSEPHDNVPAYVVGNYDTRCMKGLIVAKMVNTPKYNELVLIYDQEMRTTFQNVRQEAIASYEAVKTFLNAY